MKKTDAYVRIHPDLSEVREVKEEVTELAAALEKANSLLDKLASHKEVSITCRFKSGDK